MDPRNFRFVSADAALVATLAWQVHREGCAVRKHVAAASDRETADGVVEKSDDVGER